MLYLSLFAARHVRLGQGLVSLLSLVLIALGVGMGILESETYQLSWWTWLSIGVGVSFLGRMMLAYISREQSTSYKYYPQRILMGALYMGLWIAAFGIGVKCGNELTTADRSYTQCITRHDVQPVTQSAAVNQPERRSLFQTTKQKLKRWASKWKAKIKQKVQRPWARALLYVGLFVVGGLTIAILAVLSCSAICNEMALLLLLAAIVGPLAVLFAMSAVFTWLFEFKKGKKRQQARIWAFLGNILAYITITASLGGATLLIGLLGIGILYLLLRYGHKNLQNDNA